jgi:hypothetical protein
MEPRPMDHLKAASFAMTFPAVEYSGAAEVTPRRFAKRFFETAAGISAAIEKSVSGKGSPGRECFNTLNRFRRISQKSACGGQISTGMNSAFIREEATRMSAIVLVTPPGNVTFPSY